MLSGILTLLDIVGGHMNLRFLPGLSLFLFHTIVLPWEEQARSQHHSIFFF